MYGILTVAALWASTVLAADAVSQQKLQRAIDLMETKGDLPAAMAMFQDAARSTDRAIAARALLYLAQCQERQGKEQAQTTYQKIVKEFGDQHTIADVARERLSSFSTKKPAFTGLTTRQLWTGAELDSEGIPTLDGRHLPFVHWDSGDIAIKDLITGESKRLMLKNSWKESGDYGEWPVLSQDLQNLAFAWFDPKEGRYQLRVAPNRAGAKARVLVNNPEFTYFKPAGWAPDGKSVLAVLWSRDGTSQIAWVSTVNQSVRTLRSLEWREPNVSLSTDGRMIAYDALERRDSSARDIYVLAADGRSENIVVKRPGVDMHPVWSPDGTRLLFVSDRSGAFSLWALALHDGKAQGPARLLKTDVGTIIPKMLTRSGSLIYFQERGDENIYAATIDPHSGMIQGSPVPLSDSYIGQNRSAFWSPDGKSVAYLSRRSGIRNGPGALTLVVRSLETGEERAFPSSLNVPPYSSPAWFHDSKSILQFSRDQQLASLKRTDLKTGQTIHMPRPRAQRLRPITVIAQDDRTLYMVANEDETTPAMLFAFGLQTSGETVLYRAPERSYISSAALSSDGRKLAILVSVSNNQTRELITMNSDGSQPRTLLRTSAEESGAIMGGPGGLSWSPDGNHLYLLRRASAEGMHEVHRIAPATETKSKGTGITAKRITFMNLDSSGTKVAFSAGGVVESELWSLDNAMATLKAAR